MYMFKRPCYNPRGGQFSLYHLYVPSAHESLLGDQRKRLVSHSDARSRHGQGQVHGQLGVGWPNMRPQVTPGKADLNAPPLVTNSLARATHSHICFRVGDQSTTTSEPPLRPMGF
eukprot:4168727-Amphidinium_carterae.1